MTTGPESPGMGGPPAGGRLLAPERRDLLLGAGAGLLASASRGAQAQGQTQAQGGGAASPLPEAARRIAPSAEGRPMPQMQGEMPLPPSRRVGFAVVGLGKFTLNQILPSFAECDRARLVALVSGNVEKARRVAEHYGVDPAAIYDYAGFDRIAENPAIDVVYVILPNALHAEYTERAFRAGKHVLCEKPMAVTPAECRRMISAGREANRKLMVAYRAQYETYNLRAIELARSGELGELRLITSDHGRPLKPEDPADQWRMRRDLAGGGSLYDVGIYAVNAMRYLSGEEPVEVRAMHHTNPADPRFRDVEDLVTWQFRMPSGLLCLGSCSYSYHEAKRITVQGTKAELRLDPATDYYERRMWISRSGQEETELNLRDSNQFAAELDHMAQCVLENREPKTPGEEGLRDVVIMGAIYDAARSGRIVRIEQPIRP